MKRWIPLALGLLGALPAGSLPLPAAATSLDGLAFLAGCWSASFAGGEGVMEEFYSAPSRNLIVGASRTLRDGVAVQYEFTRIAVQGEDVFLLPYPGGQPSSDAFRLTRLSAEEAVFEAPEHDYPKRIVYRAHPDGTRTARIDGGVDDPAGQEWRLVPVACRRGGPGGSDR